MKCPLCKGIYFEQIDIGLDDGTGPLEYCGYCKRGEVAFFMWCYWYWIITREFFEKTVEAIKQLIQAKIDGKTGGGK